MINELALQQTNVVGLTKRMSRKQQAIVDTARIFVGAGLGTLFVSTDGNGQNLPGVDTVKRFLPHSLWLFGRFGRSAATCLLAGILIAISLLGCERRSSRIPPCHELLVLTDLAKLDWANNESKTTNDTPTWDDLRGYLPDWATNKLVRWTNGIPVCPDGGTYTVGRIGEPPRCSIGGYNHAVSP